MKNKITFKDENDGTISVYLYTSKIMSIGKEVNGSVKTKIYNSYESISLPSVQKTKEFILKMYS